MNIKHAIIVLVGATLFWFCCQGATDGESSLPRILDKELQEQAKSAAVAWFNALTSGDVAKVLSLSDVPFAFNGSKIVDRSENLKKAYEDLVKSKGIQRVQPGDVTVTTANSRVVKGCVPQHYFVVNLVVPAAEANVGLKGIPVAVRPGDTCKVIGFSKY
ncbi:MAG: hypothetical protein PF692_06735 [Kiritimatiellae bacterium]|jgi:hypothetical protein|nr:hypothetical protein [Kiritimatiellia bacterium]